MSEYRRAYQAGSYYFFTIVTHARQPIFSNVNNVKFFKQSLAHVSKKYPFQVEALVVMPDHIHTIWKMPEHDSDFSIRWRLIKSYCSRKIPQKPLWQNRFWEHVIRDENDLHRHLDYIYYNPVKHGYVDKVIDWPYSTFKHEVELGRYTADWGHVEPEVIQNCNFE